MSSAKGSASNLAQALKDLSVQWTQVNAYWRDVKSRQFEKNYIEPLPDHAARAMAVMEEIDLLLRKVRSDCE